ncbi:MAG: M67 family metallopeptidase [Chloroflexi bacterium]|nr:M67 family metallopeptidase [Chloroflexota bacterium]
MPAITREHMRELIEHAREANPYECCGILAGNDDVASHLYRIKNTSSNPNRYLMEPQQQLNVMLESRNQGRQLMAFYHSHPQGPAHPSTTDVRMAQKSGWLGEDIYYLLISLASPDEPDIKAFHIMENGTVVERPLTIQGAGTPQ